MSALETYCNAVYTTKGLAHLRALSALRDYIRESTDDELTPRIRQIKNVEFLRVLVEAGLRPKLLHEVTRRYDKLVPEGGETSES